RVAWTRADLSRRAARGAPWAEVGVVVANEVLDCLAHHQIVRARDGAPRVVFVVPRLRGRPVPRDALGPIMGDPRRRRRVVFREVSLPLAAVPRLRPFLARHCPDLLVARTPWPPYFACPAMATLVGNVGRLYRTAE